MSALGTALLCTFIEKAFKGLKGLVVFWRSSLLKGKIVALQFFVLLLFTDLKRLLKPERRLLWCKDHCFKNAEFYFWKKCFGHELHSFLAREYKRIPLSFDIFMNLKILTTVSSNCFTNLLSWSFIAKVLQIKTRVGQQHSPLLQSAPHFHHRRQRHLR